MLGMDKKKAILDMARKEGSKEKEQSLDFTLLRVKKVKDTQRVFGHCQGDNVPFDQTQASCRTAALGVVVEAGQCRIMKSLRQTTSVQ